LTDFHGVRLAIVGHNKPGPLLAALPPVPIFAKGYGG